MKKKTAIVLISLLMLTLLLTTSHFAPSVTAPDGPYHWKIELAQKKSNAYIFGQLLDITGAPIPDTEFELNCTCEDPDPQPHSQRVYWKVATDIIPASIYFVKYVDWNKDGIWDEAIEVVGDLVEPEEGHRWYHHQQERNLTLFPMGPVNLSDPVCSEWEGVPNMPPYAGLWHLSSWHDSGWPYGNLSYCDEVDLTPIDVPGPVDWWHVKKVSPPDEPVPVLVLDQMVVVEVHQTEISHQWQLTLKQHNCNVIWTGGLTNETGHAIPEAYFEIICNCTTLQCTVVRTPNCTLVHDIDFKILIFSKEDPGWLEPIGGQTLHEIITQFPWTMVMNGTDPYTGDKWTVELELTEVQMHRYWVMRGSLKWCMQLGLYPPVLDFTRPFRTRLPYLMPLRYCQNITFTQKDPITGIVKLGVPAESFEGLVHWYWDPDVDAWVKIEISLEEQGCGWLFTHEGKEPIYGCVDLLTYNNDSGVYTYGLDQVGYSADDELLAGPVSGNEAAGAGPPLGPCLQELRGPDGIPGTGDDPIGRGDPDGPDPPGSSLLYLPCTLTATAFAPASPAIVTKIPFPLLMTTQMAIDSVMEPASLIDGVWSYEVGEPWEFVAGLDHSPPEPGYEDVPVPWKHENCNAYVTYACAWSVLNISTPLGPMDIIYGVCEKKVREDVVIADIDCTELVDVMDLTIASLGLWGQDEGVGPDGVPNTGDDKPIADPQYDFGCQADIGDPRGLIDVVDLTIISLQLWAIITP